MRSVPRKVTAARASGSPERGAQPGLDQSKNFCHAASIERVMERAKQAA